ncbi:MAG: response regulator [Thermoplasmata archaeon]|nr:response regulator [Thermoplasmata archaeon]
MARIMIVDDEEDLLSLYGEMITLLGHDIVSKSTNGNDAIEIFHDLDDRPDIIILDHRMPFRNGLDTAKELLNIDPQEKIIFISADSSVRKTAMDIGVMIFLDKPFTLQLFKDTIENIIKN